jgi:hypothetical protein
MTVDSHNIVNVSLGAITLQLTVTQHKLIFINQQHMRMSFSSECSTFLVDVTTLKRYIDISGIHWISVGKVFYPYPTRCISSIRPDRTRG